MHPKAASTTTMTLIKRGLTWGSKYFCSWLKSDLGVCRGLGLEDRRRFGKGHAQNWKWIEFIRYLSIRVGHTNSAQRGLYQSNWYIVSGHWRKVNDQNLANISSTSGICGSSGKLLQFLAKMTNIIVVFMQKWIYFGKNEQNLANCLRRFR